MTSYLQHVHLTLPVGKVLGAIRKTIYDDTYYSFDGIPYAQPPIGELRFKAPIPARPWAGVRECFEFNTKPVQDNDLGEIEGSEDCLYLNVYAKKAYKFKLSSKDLLPVIVWIYGGSFLHGDATKKSYSPDYFLKKDVIVVTMNYRLSSLGFLSLKDPALGVPGNAGIKDQILALKWVQKFIRYFNGDPDNVTVFGNSAGSACTHYLTASEKAKGLFHKAICMSGSMLNPWALTPPKDFAYRLAKEHGYEGKNVGAKVLKYLRSLEAEKLAVYDILTSEERQDGILTTFGPCIEPYDSDECVIPADPRVMLETAWGNDIPMIFSGTSNEGYLLYRMLPPEMLKLLQYMPERLLPSEVSKHNDPGRNIELGRKIVKTQFGDRQPSDATMLDLLHFYGILFFWLGVHRSVLSRLKYAKAPTFLYRFAFDSPTFNHYRQKFCGDNIKTGAAHGDEISYLWYADYSWKLETSSNEYKAILRMINTFVNFAMKNQSSDYQDIKTYEMSGRTFVWSSLEISDPYKAMNIGQTLEMTTIPEKAELLAWDEMYENERLF